VLAIAVRQRRDFGALLTLIGAHALLHRASRDRDEAGAIIATIADYATVRELVADLFAEGIEATVPATVRETVDAISALKKSEVPVGKLAANLALDKSVTGRRVRDAAERGYLVGNSSERSDFERRIDGRPEGSSRHPAGRLPPNGITALRSSSRYDPCPDCRSNISAGTVKILFGYFPPSIGQPLDNAVATPQCFQPADMRLDQCLWIRAICVRYLEPMALRIVGAMKGLRQTRDCSVRPSAPALVRPR